jgi:hypothetical protein
VNQWGAGQNLGQLRHERAGEAVGHVVAQDRRQVVELRDPGEGHDVVAEPHRVDIAHAAHDGGLVVDEDERGVLGGDELPMGVPAGGSGMGRGHGSRLLRHVF